MPTLTITTTAEQAQRINSAFGRRLNLETIDNPPLKRDATPAEVKAEVIDLIRDVVLGEERQEALQIAIDAVPPIDPT